MKKFIKRKTFNTKTSALLGVVRKGVRESHFWEKLYINKNGDFFIHGSGGILTRWNGKEDFISVTEKTALNWISKYGN